MDFCDQSAFENENILEIGQPLCCDFEAFSNGTFNCDLYLGNDVIPHDLSYGPENFYTCYTFKYGDRAYFIQYGFMLGLALTLGISVWISCIRIEFCNKNMVILCIY